MRHRLRTPATAPRVQSQRSDSLVSAMLGVHDQHARLPRYTPCRGATKLSPRRSHVERRQRCSGAQSRPQGEGISKKIQARGHAPPASCPARPTRRRPAAMTSAAALMVSAGVPAALSRTSGRRHRSPRASPSRGGCTASRPISTSFCIGTRRVGDAASARLSAVGVEEARRGALHWSCRRGTSSARGLGRIDAVRRERRAGSAQAAGWRASRRIYAGW